MRYKKNSVSAAPGKIKAVIFDFGNVICRFDNSLFIANIAAYSELTIEQLHEVIYSNSDIPGLYETGRISTDEFYHEAVRLCRLNMTMGEFVSAFTEIFEPINETFQLIHRLSPCYKLGLLSNTNELHFQYGIKRTEVFPLFDTVTLSYEVNAMKPDMKIFLDALEKLELKPDECVFIDDIKAYADAASGLGICGIQYVSHEGLLGDLRGRGVDC